MAKHAETRSFLFAGMTIRDLAQFLLAIAALGFWALDQFTDYHWAREALLFCGAVLFFLYILSRIEKRENEDPKDL